MNLLIGGSANYFCVAIIIVKYRISWPKKLKTMFYFWSYFSAILPFPDHMYQKCPLVRGFASKTLWNHCWTASLWVLLCLCSNQCWSHKVSIGSSSTEREALLAGQIYTFYYFHIWNLSVCMHHNSGEHQFNFSAHFHSSLPTQFGCRK